MKELNKKSTVKDVFGIVNQMKLTPFESGLMMSLITKIMKHGKYDNQQKAYYLPFNLNDFVTSDADSRPNLKKAFQDFQAHHDVEIKGKANHQKLFFSKIKINK